MEFDGDAAFWVFNQVSNFAYTRYQNMIPEIQAVQSELESKYLRETVDIDKEALGLYAKSPTKCIQYLTDYSVKTADGTVDRWKSLYGYLFTRYMDGNIKTLVPGELNPDLEQPGYGEYWYQEIIEETGEKFLYPGADTH
jgi:dipeptidase